jgi:hypothetical protein
VLPGNTQGLLPAVAGYLFPGFRGNYGVLSISVDEVDLRPDVDLTVRVDRKVGPDVFSETLVMGPAQSVQFHRYDMTKRPAADLTFSIGPLQVVTITVSVTPGHVPPSTRNTVLVRGADGDQMVALVDSGDDVKDYILNLLAPFVSPFDSGGGGGGAFDVASNVSDFFCD